MRARRVGPFPNVEPLSHDNTKIPAMESVATLLIVIFQLFFGWCGEERHDPPPPAHCESNGDC
jgi:hypothetical protein